MMTELDEAEKLVEDVTDFSNTSNDYTHQKCCLKLLRKIQADVAYLRKNLSKCRPNGEKTMCNFAYLSGVYNEIKKSQNVTEVLHDSKKFGIIIDLVCEDGRTWKKVVARNPQSLHLIWAGKGQFGTKDIVAKLKQYLDSAKRQCEFSPPAIIVVCCSGITHEMAQHIESMGIEVQGDRVDTSQDVVEKLKSLVFDDSTTDDEDDDDYTVNSEDSCSDHIDNRDDTIPNTPFTAHSNLYEHDKAHENSTSVNLDQHTKDLDSLQTNSQGLVASKEFECIHTDSNSDLKDLTDPTEPDTDDKELRILLDSIISMSAEEKVFMDITTMLVYVCDICHGGATFLLNDWVLYKQCKQEQEKSALEVISPYLEGRSLITCQSALDDYKSIVDLLAGPEENRRAEALIKRLTVVPDRLSQRYLSLSCSGNIKDRSKMIFGSADYLRCPILTSNEGFIRGAVAQGIHVPAIIHQPRALSEQKRLKYKNTQL